MARIFKQFKPKNSCDGPKIVKFCGCSVIEILVLVIAMPFAFTGNVHRFRRRVRELGFCSEDSRNRLECGLRDKG